MTSATDNQTTELREKLNKLIIELDRLEITLDLSDMTLGEFKQEREKLLDGFMQAIAATLDGGTLTAEQVSKAVYAHSIHADCADANWQAIADELNDELGDGTCSIESSYLNDFTSNYECWYEFEMQCGYRFTWDEMEPPNYFPNCGRKVVSA